MLVFATMLMTAAAMPQAQPQDRPAMPCMPIPPATVTLDFDAGSADITPAMATPLMTIVNQQLSQRKLHVRITAYTDAAHPTAGVTLSQHRAMRVEQFLTDHGVMPDAITITYAGQLLAKPGDAQDAAKLQQVAVATYVPDPSGVPD